MSQRNSREQKRRRRVRRSLTKGRLPAYINLIEWVKMRSNMSTGRAVKVLMSGALRVDSHPVGFGRNPNGTKYLKVLIPAEHRGRIEIVTPEGLDV